MKTQWTPLALVAAASLIVGCPEAPPEPPPVSPPEMGSALAEDVEILVTVNGQAITRLDLQQAIASNPRARGRKLGPDQERNLLEVMVRQEILAQRALELGLEATPRIRQQLRARQAEVDALRRRLLARELLQQPDAEGLEVPEAEVRAYFEANAEVADRFHLLQILRRDPAEAERLHQRLAAGEDFEALAAEGLPPLPAAARKPWDLGFLRWSQAPEPWRPVLAKLEVGEISEVISTDRRHWILKLVARERDPEATFEFLEPALRTMLLRSRQEQQRQALEEALRARARVVYSPERPTRDL